jgi:hypothetical protein
MEKFKKDLRKRKEDVNEFGIEILKTSMISESSKQFNNIFTSYNYPSKSSSIKLKNEAQNDS